MISKRRDNQNQKKKENAQLTMKRRDENELIKIESSLKKEQIVSKS